VRLRLFKLYRPLSNDLSFNYSLTILEITDGIFEVQVQMFLPNGCTAFLSIDDFDISDYLKK